MTAAERQRRHRLLKPGAKDDAMAEATALRVPPPLPATTGDLLANRKLKAKRTINDHVEDIIVRLWEDKEFTKYIDAIYDSQAVEGNTDIDDTMAAMRIRNVARENNNKEVADQNLDTIVRAMRVGLRRYGQGRSERQESSSTPAE